MSKNNTKKLRKMNLSELLRVAVEDGRKWEAEGREFQMDNWGIEYPSGECYACLAGAVLYRKRPEEWRDCLIETGVRQMRSLQPAENIGWMTIIDFLRQGYISEAADCYGGYRLPVEAGLGPALNEMDDRWSDLYLRAYPARGRLTWEQYEQMAAELEELGL